MIDVTRGKLPFNITSYDLLKTFAVVTMIIDHIGYYFFPEQNEWRVVGRMSLPVWMFLIGYANTRDIPMILVGGAMALVAGNIVAGMPMFSLNILFAVMVIRLSLDSIMRFATSSVSYMFMMVLTLTILFFPANYIIEYGTLSVMLAMFGYMVRHQTEIKYNNESLLLFMGVATLIYSFYQKLVMGMDNTEFYTMMAGVAFVMLILSQFRAAELPGLTRQMGIFAPVLKFTGRRTLEIYVVHLLIFKAFAMGMYPDRFSLFNFSLFP